MKQHSLTRDNSPDAADQGGSANFSFEGMKMNKFLSRNYGANQTVQIYNKQNGKPFRPQSGVRNHHNKTNKMNKKVMDRYVNENLDSRNRYHNKVPEDLYS